MYRKLWRFVYGAVVCALAVMSPAAAQTPAPTSIRTIGDCSPIVTNAAGDVRMNLNCRVYQEPQVIQPRAIATVLGLGGGRPNIFRLGGPGAAEFDAGQHPFDPADAEKFLAQLDTLRGMAVRAPASEWRAHYVRFVGWFAQTKGRTVLYTDAATWTEKVRFTFPEAFRAAPAPILLIENAHWGAENVAELVQDARSANPQAQIVISAGGLLGAPRHQMGEIGGVLESFPIANFPSARIRERFVEIARTRFGRPDLLKSDFQTLLQELVPLSRRGFSDPGDRHMGLDLWLAAGVFSGWKGDAEVRTDKLAGTALTFFRDRYLVPLQLSSPEATELFIVMCVVTRYNAHAPRVFLTADLGFGEGVVDQFIKSEILVATPKGLTLRDPALSSLGLAAVGEDSEVVAGLRRRLGGPGLAWPLIIRAVRFSIPNYDTLLLNASARLADRSDGLPSWIGFRVDGQKSLDALVGAARQAIEAERRAGPLGRALLALSQLGVATSALAEDVRKTLPEVVAYHQQGRAELKDVAWLALGLHAISPELGRLALAQYDKGWLAARVSEEKRIGRIASTLWAINRVDPSVALSAAAPLAALLSRGNPILLGTPAQVGWFLEVLGAVDQELGNAFVRKILESNDFADSLVALSGEDAVRLLLGVAKAGPAAASALLKEVTADRLALKIRAVEESEDVAELLLAIARADPIYAKTLFSKIGAQEIARLLRKTSDVGAGLIAAALRSAKPGFEDSLLADIRARLGAAIADAQRSVDMFSMMSPTAMFQAMGLRDMLQHRDDMMSIIPAAETGLLQAGGSVALVSGNLLKLSKARKDLAGGIIRKTAWDRVAMAYAGAAHTPDGARFAEFLAEADPTRFGDWLDGVATRVPGQPLWRGEALRALWAEGVPAGVVAWLRANPLVEQGLGARALASLGLPRWVVLLKSLQRQGVMIAPLIEGLKVQLTRDDDSAEALNELLALVLQEGGGALSGLAFGYARDCPSISFAQVKEPSAATRALKCLTDLYKYRGAAKEHVLRAYARSGALEILKGGVSLRELQSVVASLFELGGRESLPLLPPLLDQQQLQRFEQEFTISISDDAPEFVAILNLLGGKYADHGLQAVLNAIRHRRMERHPDPFFFILRAGWTSKAFSEAIIAQLDASTVTELLYVGGIRSDALVRLIRHLGPHATIAVDWKEMGKRLGATPDWREVVEILALADELNRSAGPAILKQIDPDSLRRMMSTATHGVGNVLGRIARLDPDYYRILLSKPTLRSLAAEGLCQARAYRQIPKFIAALRANDLPLWHWTLTQLDFGEWLASVKDARTSATGDCSRDVLAMIEEYGRLDRDAVLARRTEVSAVVGPQTWSNLASALAK